MPHRECLDVRSCDARTRSQETFMPTKSAAKKATKKTSAKMHKGKSLNNVKPLKDLAVSESVSLNFTKPKLTYTPQGS
jgi:hypothetical protein